MKVRFRPTMVLAGLLVIASGGKDRPGGLGTMKTPIIVGDGSIHILSTHEASFQDSENHGDKNNKKKWSRKDKGKDGTFGKVWVVGYELIFPASQVLGKYTIFLLPQIRRSAVL